MHSHRRSFHVNSRLKDSGERRPDTREHDAPKDRGKNCEPQTGRIHQNVKQQNVHDDRSEDRQRERHESINQEQSARDHLEPENGHQIVRNEQCSEELSRDSAGRRHRNEVKKSVKPEDRKDQGQKEPTDVS